ncbi:MAG: hypothetical protein HY982_00155 [Candidatus Magasanikbacteria bacterium]|nr:hypothetical protein [Candidatus Magasanikbacteria bacterium]
MEIKEIRDNPQHEAKRVGKFFNPDDILTKKDCISFDDYDYGGRLTIREGTFRRVGQVRGQIDKRRSQTFLDLLVAVGEPGLPQKYFLRDSGERIQLVEPDEFDTRHSYRIEPGTPQIIPVNFQES